MVNFLMVMTDPVQAKPNVNPSSYGELGTARASVDPFDHYLSDSNSTDLGSNTIQQRLPLLSGSPDSKSPERSSLIDSPAPPKSAKRVRSKHSKVRTGCLSCRFVNITPFLHRLLTNSFIENVELNVMRHDQNAPAV